MAPSPDIHSCLFTTWWSAPLQRAWKRQKKVLFLHWYIPLLFYTIAYLKRYNYYVTHPTFYSIYTLVYQSILFWEMFYGYSFKWILLSPVFR
jgi:hypothetical protein